MVIATLRPLYARGRDPVHIVQEAGWAPGPSVLTSAEISPLPGFDALTIQPVASLYADWAIPAHGRYTKGKEHEKDIPGGKKVHEYKEIYP